MVLSGDLGRVVAVRMELARRETTNTETDITVERLETNRTSSSF